MNPSILSVCKGKKKEGQFGVRGRQCNILSGELLYANDDVFSLSLPLLWFAITGPARCSQPALPLHPSPRSTKNIIVSLFLWLPLDLYRSKTGTRRLNLEQFTYTSSRRLIVPNHPAFPKIIFHNRRFFRVTVGDRALGIDAFAVERHAKGRVDIWNDQVD